MPAVTECPDRQIFQQFFGGKLSVQDVLRLEEHLGQCASCRQTLQEAYVVMPAPPRQDDPVSAAVQRVCSRFFGAAGSASLDATRDDLPRSREMASALEATAADLPRSKAASGDSATDFALGSGAVSANPALDATSDSIPAAKSEASTQRTELSGSRAGPKAEEADDLSFLSPPQQPGEIGRLGPYIIVKVLGKGGMGMVFKCLDPKLHRPVALKVMLPNIAKDESARQRFTREARATAAIKNDHVITIYEVDEDNGIPYLAMEFLEGEPLDQWMRPGRVPQAPEILRIGKEIAKGLAAAHDRGMIHRDIKPGNIWLEAPNNRIKILDFGLARTITEDLHLTKTGLIVGTPAYMAPEQAGGEQLDHRCDLFSMGCVLYRLCVGELPFTGSSTIAILKALALKDPKPIRDVNPAIPPALADVVMRLLAKKPGDRPQTAHIVVETIESIERNFGMFASSSRTAMMPLPAAPPPGADSQRTEQLSRERAPLPPPPLRRPVPATPSSSSRRRSERSSSVSKGTIALALFFLVIAGGGGYFLYDKIRASKGAIEIISEDPKVEVQLLRNGEPVKTIFPDREPRLDFDAGEYDVRLKKGTRGLKVEPDHILVRHDAKAVVRISRGFASDSAWVRQVSGQPPEQQLKAVLAKLKEENADFDGAAVDKTVDQDGVTVFTLRTDKVQDISPVRALEKLKTLGFMSTAGMLEDISPLKGLKLESLDCGANRIKDLSPLKGMPLKLLLLGENPVVDLTPLKDLPLETLEIKNLDKVSDPLVLKSIRSLKTINFKPADLVLKQLEAKAGEKNK